MIPSSVNVIEDNVEWTYNLTVGAGETKRLAQFTVLGTTRAQAIAAANALVTNSGFGGEAAAFLTAGELASLANFQFNSPPTDIALSSATPWQRTTHREPPLEHSQPPILTPETRSPIPSSTAQATPTTAVSRLMATRLKTAAAFNFETRSSYSILVRTTDQAGLSTEKAFTIQVTDADEIPPTVTTTTFLTSGVAMGGTTALSVSFSEPVLYAAVPTNYELRRAGADGLLGNADDPLITITSASVSGNTATLNFAGLPEDVYRLTVKDTITDVAANALDGDANGIPGGVWRRDFVAGALTTSLTSPNGFTFDPEFGGFGAGQLVQGTGNAFDGLNRLNIGGTRIHGFTQQCRRGRIPGDWLCRRHRRHVFLADSFRADSVLHRRRKPGSPSEFDYGAGLRQQPNQPAVSVHR